MQFHLALRRCLESWKAQGSSRFQLAKEVGCSVASISHWANDRRPIEHHSAKALFQVLVKRLTEDAEQEALLDLARGYSQKFPDRPSQEIYDLVQPNRPEISEVESRDFDALNSVIEQSENPIHPDPPPSIQKLSMFQGFLPSFALLCAVIFVALSGQFVSSAELVWGQVWVEGQFSPVYLMLWSFLTFFVLFFFLGLEGKGAINRAHWVKNGAWRDQYVSTVTRALDTIDLWVLSGRRARALSPTSFSRNWSIELYEKVLLFAILYPILAVMVQWFVTGSAQAFGQLVIWPSDDVFLQRLLIFTTFVSSVPIAFFARSRERKFWQVTICVAAIILNFVGYIACREFYDGVDVGPGAVNMAAIAFTCGIGLRAFDNVAVPTTAASLAGASLSFAFLPILNVAELLTGKPGAGYDDADIRLVHTLINHGLNIVLFICFVKILSKFINRESIEKKSYFGVTIYVSAAIGTAILMFVAATQGFWTEYYLFLGLIPLLNGIFDYFSIGLTRYTLRLGSQNFGIKTIFMSVADLCLALLLFATLILSAVGVMLLLDHTSGGVIFAEQGEGFPCGVGQIVQTQTTFLETPAGFTDDLSSCSETFVHKVLYEPTDYAWLIFIFASTLLPTVVHLSFALFALGPALLGHSVRTVIADWSLNAHEDLFQRGAAAFAFGLWLALVAVAIVLVIERVIWVLFGIGGLLPALQTAMGTLLG